MARPRLTACSLSTKVRIVALAMGVTSSLLPHGLAQELEPPGQSRDTPNEARPQPDRSEAAARAIQARDALFRGGAQKPVGRRVPPIHITWTVISVANDDGPPVRIRGISDGAFYDAVYGGVGFGETQRRELYRRRLNTLLNERLSEVRRTVTLSSEQEEKLRLAGRGDIKRYFEQIDAKYREFEQLRTDLAKGTHLVQEFARERVDNPPFRKDSLFEKVLRNIADGHDAG